MNYNHFIVKFIKDVSDPSNTTEKVNANLRLEESTIDSPAAILIKSTDENNEEGETLLYKIISKNFAEIEFNNSKLTILLKYNIYKSMIEFDQNSSSAYKNFKNNLQELINSKLETKYYSNGKIMYAGEVLELENKSSIFHGKGILYFDSDELSKKYSGEFENGEYDGEGKFYSKEKNLYLIANNISKGIPLKRGKLYINFKNNKQTIDVDFSSLWKSFNLNDKETIKKFVDNDNFVKMVTNFYWPETEKDIDDVLFEQKSLEEQNLILLNELKLLRHEVLELKNNKPKVYDDAVNKLFDAITDLTGMFIKDLFSNIIKLGEIFVVLSLLFKFLLIFKEKLIY